MKISHQSTLGIFVLFLFCFQNAYSRRGNKKKKRDPMAPKWKVGSRPESGNNIESITEGDDIALSCSAIGKPKPDITWYKNKEVIDITFDNRMKLKKHTFQILNAEQLDKGNYSCSVTNKYGSLEFTYIVDVVVRIWPLEITGPKNITVQEGETARFFCRALNDPDAQIKWMIKPNNSSNTGPSIDQPTSVSVNPEVFVIEDVTLDDAGTYTCLVGNYYGLQYHEAWLTVIPLPRTVTSTTPTTTTTTTTAAPTTVLVETTTEKQEINTTEYPRKHGGRGKGKDRNRDRDRVRDRPRDRDREEKKRERERNKNNKLNNNRNHKNNLNLDFEDSTPSVVPHIDDSPEIKWNSLPEPDYSLPGTSSDPDDESNVTAAGTAGQNEDKISVWTIYIIVGAVAGGILIIGLVSILVAICCQKEEGADYKSTSV